MTSTTPVTFDEPVDTAWMDKIDQNSLDKAVSVALGKELRGCREQRGWSRLDMVSMLPSGIGDRTLLAYEYGTRVFGMPRFVELCRALGVTPAEILERALQAAKVALESVALRVDLNVLIKSRDVRNKTLLPWARNRVRSEPTGVVSLHPLAAREMAAMLGCDWLELAGRLAEFLPPLDMSSPSAEAAPVIPLVDPDEPDEEQDRGVTHLDECGHDDIENEIEDGADGERPTWRELSIMDRVAQGMTTNEIADKLHVRAGVIDADIGEICRKLGVDNRGRALARCLKNGWVPLSTNDSPVPAVSGN
jgi:DNA-binding CsgD family transcriptional regulator/transcriptional regulator with XRE-family HTH domain